ncbi:MAG: hypothetical protein K2W96_05930 [Gemmataceae bacterium]|nr:hypothetical protein [Gemmataceae bacterium]
MAKTMKATAPAKRPALGLTIKVDPLAVGRGHRSMRRGGLHGTMKHPGRAASKRRLRDEDALLV